MTSNEIMRRLKEAQGYLTDVNKAIASMESAREYFMNHKEEGGCWFTYLDRIDNKDFAIVMGWQDGYEIDENDNCSYENWHLCAKLAYQPSNNMMQCDYDCDWDMPYDEDINEVYDTNEMIFEDTDLRDVITRLLEAYNSYTECIESEAA